MSESLSEVNAGITSRPSNPLTCPSQLIPGPWFEQHFDNLEEHSRNLCISMNKGKNKSQIQYKSFIFFPHDAESLSPPWYIENDGPHTQDFALCWAQISQLHTYDWDTMLHHVILLEFKPNLKVTAK